MALNIDIKEELTEAAEEEAKIDLASIPRDPEEDELLVEDAPADDEEAADDEAEAPAEEAAL